LVLSYASQYGGLQQSPKPDPAFFEAEGVGPDKLSYRAKLVK
jgi:hypothetical protein